MRFWKCLLLILLENSLSAKNGITVYMFQDVKAYLVDNLKIDFFLSTASKVKDEQKPTRNRRDSIQVNVQTLLKRKLATSIFVM